MGTCPTDEGPVPRYFFHTRHKDGWLDPDHVGSVLADDHAAALEALRRGGYLALNGFGGGSVEVVDAAGWLVISKQVGTRPKSDRS